MENKLLFNFKDNTDPIIITLLNSDLIKDYLSNKKDVESFLESKEVKIWEVWFSATAENHYYKGTFKQVIYHLKKMYDERSNHLFFSLEQEGFNEFDIIDLEENIIELP